jgi:CDGSH-type Zn-finger protein
MANSLIFLHRVRLSRLEERTLQDETPADLYLHETQCGSLASRPAPWRKPFSKITVSKDGPYLVSGNLPLSKVTIGTNAEGESVRWEWGHKFEHPASYALFRCGGSANKPYCDGSHTRLGFDGTETASRKPYREQAKIIPGPVLSLSDAEGLCAFARFCNPNG